MTRTAQRTAQFSLLNAQFLLLAGMAAGLALFYRGSAAPLAVLGLAIFAALALLRPDLGLLFVPLTAPLYLIPASIAGLRAGDFLLPLHEAALLVAAGAGVAGWVWRALARRGQAYRRDGPALAALAARYAPHALFVLAGSLGVLLAAERGRALIEFRRLVAEPLIFYALVKYYLANPYGQRPYGRSIERPDDKSAFSGESIAAPSLFPASSSAYLSPLLVAFVLGGALAGLLGLLQYVGLDLVPLLGRKQCFAPDGGPCANIVADGGVRRVLSVYGHPNNLGLYLGRVWPVAAALALAAWRLRLTDERRWLLFGLGSLLCLGGIVVSFSRGAWLGVVAAAAVLALGLADDQRRTTTDQRATLFSLGRWSLVGRRSSLRWLVGMGVALAVLAGLALSIRGDVTAGSTPVRLLLWREAIGYIARHPLGIGLDQFGFYHDPANGLSLIDPALIGTSEQYAAHPHNLLLDIWLRLGPLGLVAFGWLLARFFRAGLRRASAPLVLGALAAMVAALAHGIVDNFYFVPDLALAFWLLIALIETTYAVGVSRLRQPPSTSSGRGLDGLGNRGT